MGAILVANVLIHEKDHNADHSRAGCGKLSEYGVIRVDSLKEAG